MYRISKEKIKTYILLVLISTSILQVGILWNRQSHGFPTSFLNVFFNSLVSASADTPDKAREEYFLPFRLIVCDSEFHWLLDREDEKFEKLWNEAKYYISGALKVKPVLTLPSTEWGNLITKKSIVFEFKSDVHVSLLKWFLNIEKTEGPGERGMYKMLIAPWEDINENINTVYILEDSEIYKYIMVFNSEGMDRKDYTALLADINDSKEYRTKSYKTIKEMDPARKMLATVDPDILCVTSAPKWRSLKKVSYSVPDEIQHATYSQNLNDLAQIVLGSENKSYDRSLDIYNTIVFKTNDRIYRIYDSGLLEYKYILDSHGNNDSDAGSCFLNVFRFISKLEKHLVSGADIYLSGMEEEDGGVYRFTFDYTVDQIPVLMDLGPMGKDSLPVKNAIVIRADSARVLECRWVLKEFNMDGREEDYNMFIEDLQINLGKYIIDDILVSYVVNSDEAGYIDPSWVIERPGDETLLLPFSSEKGD